MLLSAVSGAVWLAIPKTHPFVLAAAVGPVAFAVCSIVGVTPVLAVLIATNYDDLRGIAELKARGFVVSRQVRWASTEQMSQERSCGTGTGVSGWRGRPKIRKREESQ